jgi:uncharacterized MAPEG superfamily protein
MAWVDLVLMAALLEFMVFGWLVGSARGRHGVKAPAMAGHPVVERWLRVHGNTLEQLIVFIPSLWGAARYWQPEYVAGIGAVFIIGRALYAAGYVKDPRKRDLGFLVGIVPVAVLLLATVVGAVRTLL